MHVEVTFNFRVVDGNTFESSEVFSSPIGPAQDAAGAEHANEPPVTPVLPLGSSTIAPGLTMAIDC
jgi:hypothetical protein